MTEDNAPRDKFAEEKKVILKQAKEGISSNIPLSSLQKKYLKNLLYYSMMKASANETVIPKNFIKLVNKTFKKFLLKIFKNRLPHAEEEDFYDENLEVELNNIMAHEQRLNLEQLSQVLVPKNIIAEIRQASEGVSSREVIKKIMAIREAHENQRETPEETRKREQRIRQYQRQKSRQNVRIASRQREYSR